MRHSAPSRHPTIDLKAAVWALRRNGSSRKDSQSMPTLYRNVMIGPASRSRLSAAALVIAGVASACALGVASHDSPPEGPELVTAHVRPLALVDTNGDDLAPLRRAIGSRRIVLLGENGHGVSEFASLKARVVRDLHDRLGFDIVAFESGYYDCARADFRLLDRPAAGAWRDCLAYTFEQAGMLPVFQLAHDRRSAGHAFTIGGIDLQTQGATTATRPQFLRESINGVGLAALADSVAAADSTLIRYASSGGDTLRAWLVENGSQTLALFERAAPRLSGTAHWSMESASALLSRLLARVADSSSAAFFAARDEWMARTVAQLADSTGRSRKIVVWLHNDHARYGEWTSPNGSVLATGARLRARYPNDVFSVGFFMGHGQIANNSRVTREVGPIPPDGIEEMFDRSAFAASLLTLIGAPPVVASWAAREQRYLRGGLTLDSLRPGLEFDALIYARRVSPPSYRLQPPK